MDFDAALARFGLSSFRPGQREIVSHLMSGNDCLCVMPTGGGKSLCYQLPSLLRPGLTIVVSPLIALMKDQVDALARRGIAAALINSTLTQSEQNQRLYEVTEGKFSMVYVAPERLRNQRFMEAIRATPVQLLAVDEAHCISEWGHDFRPDYARIGKFREALGGVQTVALTATATPRVRQDICDILRLKHPKQFVTGFARKNLYMGAVTCHGDRDKDKAMIEFLKTMDGSGIIYAATRKRCEALVELIGKEVKMPVGAYHAGLSPEQRQFIQEQFMTGKLKAIVATNAFGMGIDKANLRYVIHYNIPGSLEAYYQEAGRAGRDGLPSQCVVLYSAQDRQIQEFFIENANPPRELIERVYEFIQQRTEDPIELTAQEIREAIDVPQSNEAVSAALQVIARTGVIERLEMSGGLGMVRISSNLPTLVDMLPKEASTRRKVLRIVERAVGDRRDEAVYIHPRWLMQESGLERDALGRALSELRKLDCFDYVPPFRGRAIHFRKRDIPFDQLTIDFKALDERKRADYEKLDQVVAFAQGRRCRQLSILQYFGDPTGQACGICDRCQGFSGWPKITLLPQDSTTSANISAPQSLSASTSPQTTDGSSATATAKTEFDPLGKTVSSEGIVPAPSDLQYCQYIQRLLQCVDRMHGRLGKLLLADFFSGSENEKVQRLRLNRLSGFGLLKENRKKTVIDLMEMLLTHGILEQQEAVAKRPTVLLSDAGREIATGKRHIPETIVSLARKLQWEGGAKGASIALQSSKKEATNKETAKATSPADTAKAPTAETALKAAISAENRSVDVKVAIPAAVRIAELEKEIETKLQGRVDRPSPIPPVPVATQLASMDWEWTIRLVENGYRLPEIVAIRRKSVDEVLDDLTLAVKNGRSFSTDRLLDQRTQLAVRQVATDPDTASHHSVFRERPSLWRLAIALSG